MLDIDLYAHFMGTGTGTIDYGDGIYDGTDLKIENSDTQYEKDNYGKIVTSEIFLRPDRCFDLSALKSRLINVYSDPYHPNRTQQNGDIPEFIVFDHVLTEEERFDVETYLALKYGISKKLDYTDGSQVIWDAEKNDDYTFRITGIGSCNLGLDQVKSTSYYDEIYTGRKVLYETKGDYSTSNERLLAISVADEMQSAQQQWGVSSSLIWSDDATDLTLNDLSCDDNIEHITRNWRSQSSDLDASTTDEVLWGNFFNLKNEAGYITKKYKEDERIGFLSSSKATALGLANVDFSLQGLSNLEFDLGFASNNQVFVEISNPEYSSLDFYFMLSINGNSVTVKAAGLNGVLSTIGTFSVSSSSDISLQVNTTDFLTYDFEVLKDGTVQRSHSVTFEKEVDLFCKGLLYDYGSKFRIDGTNGFREATIGAGNVEYSYLRLSSEFDLDKIEKGVDSIFLMVDRSGTAEYCPSTTEFYPGTILRSPESEYDKFKFYNVDFKGLTDDCSTFTLGRKKCLNLVSVEELSFEPADCCGQFVRLNFEIQGCHTEDLEYYITNCDETFFIQGDVLFNSEISVDLPEDCYCIVIGSIETGEVYRQCDILLDNPNSVPEDLIPDMAGCLDESEPLLVDGSMKIDESQYYDVIYEWRDDQGNVVGNVAEFGINTEGQSGIYTLRVIFICYETDQNGVRYQCEVIDQIDLCITQMSCTYEIDLDCNNQLTITLDGCDFDWAILDFSNNLIQKGNAVDGDIVNVDLSSVNSKFVYVFIRTDCCGGDITREIRIHGDVLPECFHITQQRNTRCTSLDLKDYLPDHMLCYDIYYSKDGVNFNLLPDSEDGVLLFCEPELLPGESVVIRVDASGVTEGCDPGFCFIEELVTFCCIEPVPTGDFGLCASISLDGMHDPTGPCILTISSSTTYAYDPVTNVITMCNLVLGSFVDLHVNVNCGINVSCDFTLDYVVGCRGGSSPLGITSEKSEKSKADDKSHSLSSIEGKVNPWAIQYTNPSSKGEWTSFSVETGQEEELIVYVFNSSGKIIHSVKSGAAVIHKFELEFDSGIYFINLRSSSHQESFKLIIQ